MTKKRTLDIERVDAALKRAAAASVHGNVDERAGRFIGRASATGQRVAVSTGSLGKVATETTTEKVNRK